MKTITKLLVVSFFAFGVKTNAQITYLRTYRETSPINSFQNVYLKHSGFKFVYLHSDTLSFYNLNLSLYENAIIPGGAWGGVRCIAEGLFDNDTLHIDYLITGGDSTVIYKDDGSVVYRNDSAILTISFPGMGAPAYWPIMATDSGTYMALLLASNFSTQLYKLPGSLPCIPGCLGDISASSPVINNISNATMKVYPNPAVSYTNIYYTLPPGTNEGELVLYDLAGREMKKYTVTSQVDHLRLTTSDITAGTYFYQLSVNGNGVSTKKVVVVK